jgi:hypothetical protein
MEGFKKLMKRDLISKGHFTVHQAIVLKLGLEKACFLHALVRFHARVMKSKGYKWNRGWFFYTVEEMQKELGLSYEVQARLLKQLSEADGAPIEVARFGCPPRRHIRINAKWIHRVVTLWLLDNGYLEVQNTSDQGTPSTGEPRYLEPENHDSNYRETAVLDPSQTPNSYIKSKATRKKAGHFSNEKCRTHKMKECPHGKPSGSEYDQETREQGAYLFGVLVDEDDDLVHAGPKRRAVTREGCMREIDRVKKERNATNEDVWKFIKWYKKAYWWQYIRRLWALTDMCTYWGKYQRDMGLWELDQREGTNGHMTLTGFGTIDTKRFKLLAQDSQYYRYKVDAGCPEDKLYKAICYTWQKRYNPASFENPRRRPTQEELDVVLQEFGLPAGFINPVYNCMAEAGV